MATIAVGDIHGNLHALDDLLGRLRGDLGQNDTVVFLGDYIDRGPDSRGCVDRILEFRGNTRAAVVCLRGNHEDWLLRTMDDYSRHSWLIGMESWDTIHSYSPEAVARLRQAISAKGLAFFVDRVALPYDLLFDSMPRDHQSFFRNLVAFHRGPDGLCVHAGVDPGVEHIEHQGDHALTWGVSGFPENYAGSEIVAYGHRNNAVLDAEGWPRPRFVGTTIGLDTISHGVLTAVRLNDRRVFQSRRHTMP